MKRTDNTWIADLEASPEGRRLLERERVYVEATENLASLMEAEGVSRADLARRLDVSRPTVTNMLAGTRNLTLGTLADAFHALNRSMHVTYGPPTNEVQLVPKVSEVVYIKMTKWDSLEAALLMSWDTSNVYRDPPFELPATHNKGAGVAA